MACRSRLTAVLSVVLVAVLPLTACGRGDGTPVPTSSPGGVTAGTPDPTNAVPPAGTAALMITTQIGEQCPHIPITPDPRCDPKPRPGTGFDVRDPSGTVVAQGRSDSGGHAKVFVDPGRYVIRGEPVAGYQFTPHREVVVSGGDTVAVPLTYTTGIQ